MRSGAVIVIVIGLGLFILVGLFAPGLITLTSTQTSTGAPREAAPGTPAPAEAARDPLRDPLREPPPDGTSAIVYGTYRASSGLRIFGIQIRAADYAASVGFVPPADCDPPAGVVLASDSRCTGVPAEGAVTGGGTTRSGSKLIIVQIPISAECYELLREGDAWPSAHAACRDS